MKIYKKNNVYEEALERIRYLFDEFEHVIVGFSGGKDSTVTFNMCLIVAREKNRLPLKVMFVDQEAEWQSAIDHVKEVMYHPDVDPMWFQMPFKITNSTSTENQFLKAWDPAEEDKWIHEKDPISIKENVYNTDRFDHTVEFYEIFTEVMRYHYPDQKACYIAGVRCEESPSRFIGLTHHACYKWVTWGKILDKKREQFTFYPLYDWSYTDIWKAIHQNGWSYCEIYDKMYQHGVPVQGMRVSNLHHETAVHALFFLQVVEKETYNRAVIRLKGIDTAGKVGKDDFFIKELPSMFKSWKEYRDFLVEKLIPEDKKELYYRKFASMDKKYANIVDISVMHKAQVSTVIINDYSFVKLNNWERKPELNAFRKHERGQAINQSIKNKYIKP